LRNIVKNPRIIVGEYTIYHDFDDPLAFERKNVLYHYPINSDRLLVGKFSYIACGAKFIFNGANHTLNSLSTYPFAIMGGEWEHSLSPKDAWDNHGDIVVGNDVWIGFEAVILAGVKIGDGAIIGARSVVTKDVAPYCIVGGVPAKPIRQRFAPEVAEALATIQWWNWNAEKISAHLPAILAGDLTALLKRSDG
jgi:virginiamycin A acetyltransferase